MYPTISIVTAVYNRVDTIRDALASVHGQTWTDVEHVVVDGGSSDGTLAVLSEFRDRIAILISEPDHGIYDALNKGLSRATGEIVGLMHSDDYYADGEVLAAVAGVFDDPAIDGVYGDLDYVARNNPARVIRRWRSGEYDRRRLQQGWMPPHPTLFLRRAVLERWGGFDTSFRIAADYDAMLRYLAQGNIRLGYLPRVLVKMRWGGESNRSLAHILRKSREDLRALRKNRVGGLGTLFLKNASKVKQLF